jgi:5-methyltetrahydrofolate--homocysteine methyltransferase
MKPLLERLEEEILVCDGAMGTQLIKNGMPVGESPEYWGIKHKKILLGIHRSYIDAGADMIITNTFGANRIKLKKFRLEKKAPQINAEAVKAAKEASSNMIYVLGDLGPTGEYLTPVGNLKFDECYNAFSEQVKIFESEGADAVIIETMTDIEELKAAMMAVKENIKLPLIASMTFNKTEQGAYRTTSGVSIPQMVDEMLLAGADAIGSNCGIDISQMVEIIAQMRPLSTAFIIAQPNAGLPKLLKGETVYEQSPEDFQKHISELIGSGVNIVGGCCGTTPEHIREIRKIVDKIK